MAKLVGRRRPSTAETEDDKWSRSGQWSSEEPLKAKKCVKRRAKVMKKPAESSDEEEEEESRKQQRRQRRRKVLARRGNPVPPQTSCDVEEEEENRKQQKRRRKVLLRRANYVPAVTTSDCEDEAAISGEIDISSEWKTIKSFAEEKTKSAATPCGVEALSLIHI